MTSAGIMEAERLDRAGRHADAIDALARATRHGDLEAKTRLAKRLLVGDRAPRLPADGVRFLTEAANAGDHEAAMMLAVLMAAGAYVPHDWPAAWRILTAAAERGWEPARSQLLALAPEGSAAPSASEEWRRLGESIDPAELRRAPRGRAISEEPLIMAFAGFATRKVCDWLVERSRGRLQRSRVYHALRHEEMASETRTNSEARFGLLDADLVSLCVQARMAAASGLAFDQLEAMAVLHYAAGEENLEHFDFVDPRVPNYEHEIRQRGQRVITFLVYLNDEYTGGETDFPELGIKHKGQAGEGISFVNALPDGRPDLRMVHAGRAPIHGEKWVVSQFIRDRRVLA